MAALLWRAFVTLRRTQDPARALMVAALAGAVFAGAVDTSFSFSTPFITPWFAVLQGFLFAMTRAPQRGRLEVSLTAMLRRPGRWRHVVRVGGGLVLVALSLLFFVEAARLPLADAAYMRALRADDPVGQLRRAVRLAPRDPTYALSLAQAYERTGDGTAALATYQASLGRVQWDPGLTYYRAALLMQSGEAASAEQAFRDILDRDPYNGPALIALGQVLIETGRVGESIGPLTVATGFADNDPRAWYALGVAYEESNDKRAAARSLQQGLGADAIGPGGG